MTMTVKVIGVGTLRSGNFNGKAWEHRKLYVSYPVNGIKGEKVEALTIRPVVSELVGIEPGQKLELDFDRYNNVCSVLPFKA